MLTENGYLRLDPFIIYHPIYEAGLYLAKQGKEEHHICVAALKQYSIPLPSVRALVEEIEGGYYSFLNSLQKQDWQPKNFANALASASGDISDNLVAEPLSSLPNQQAIQTEEAIPLNALTTSVSINPAPAPSGSGMHRNFWPDGTLLPPTNEALNLYEWVG